MDIDKIKHLCINKSLRWTNHMLIRLLQRQIALSDIEAALLSGEVIELYPEDYPYPSCLILGFTVKNTAIHIVCGVSETELWLITAYYPDKTEWTDGFKRRKV